MLNALLVSVDGASADGLLRAARSMERQGFRPAARLAWPGGVVQAWSWPQQDGTPDCVVETAAGVACCVGPLWYRGRFGATGLERMMADVDAGRTVDPTELRGNYALFLRTRNGCTLRNDALGLVRIYTSPDGCMYSTSWLAACAYAGSVELDEAAAAEYVLLGASHSYRSVAHGIGKLALGRVVDLEHRRLIAGEPLAAGGGTGAAATLDQAVDAISAHLRTVFREIAGAFPGRVLTALSGGFDSRLILAGLLASGVRPDLYVYGGADSEDVPVARAVAEGLHMPLTVIDKDALDRDAPEPDLDRLVDSALFFDGLPADGILDRGSDRVTRLRQSAHGSLGLNGGGGEIFRNYFHLPNRRFHPSDVVRAYYRGFDRGVFRRPAAFARYCDGMAASMRDVLTIATGTSRATGSFDRCEVELLYPAFRCHHWMAVNNSVEARHGYYATPLVDFHAVRLAYELPLRWKNAGLLESRLIKSLHAKVAEQPSAYEFRFSDGPDRRARRSEFAMLARPVFARPFINLARRRLHGTRASPGQLRAFRRILPGEWRLDPFLDLAGLPDEGAMRRALSVEIVWRKVLRA